MTTTCDGRGDQSVFKSRRSLGTVRFPFLLTLPFVSHLVPLGTPYSRLTTEGALIPLFEPYTFSQIPRGSVMMRFAFVTLVSLALVATTRADAWSKSHDIVGIQFYDHFRFEAEPDPTHGRV